MLYLEIIVNKIIENTSEHYIHVANFEHGYIVDFLSKKKESLLSLCLRVTRKRSRTTELVSPVTILLVFHVKKC